MATFLTVSVIVVFVALVVLACMRDAIEEARGING